uniref:Uncharacterized protein n=1 Tax=viral metagenome TaxID=1070528 RepID=A0A6C0ETM5_9ZZZZ
MARTIKNQFSNVYGEGKNLNIGKNKSVKEMLNNIPNAPNENNDMNNESLVTNSSKTFHLETKLESNSSKMTGISSPFNLLYVIILLLLFTIIGVVYYYKDMVLHYLSGSKIDKNDKIDNTTAKVEHTSSKVDAASTKIDDTSAKIDNLEEKINKLSDKTCPTSNTIPAVNTLNNKMDKISTYSKEQNVTENGFCYIGYDNGQRDCVDVYAGDVCMSGEIFPTLDICINPKLRA